VEGRSEEELSSCVHVHFCEEHGMKGPPSSSERESGSESTVIAGGRTGYGSDIERGTRMEPRSEESEGNKRWSAAGRPNEEPSTRGSEFVAESRTRQTGERIGEREERKMSSEGSSISSPEAYGVSCPGCRERVTGRSEGETSERLKEHMATEHKNEPYMTRLMERISKNR
jgi:predicted small metal-binding protein